MVAFNPESMDPVADIRALLGGSVIVVVGGDRRATHIERLERCFELRGLLWVPTRESDASSARFEPALRRPEVLLVVALQGLLRHQHTHDLRELCRRNRLPMAACWRSPHPTGLAAAIVQQRLSDAIRRRRLFWN